MSWDINIVSFLWGRWCMPYGVEYVIRLHDGVRNNCSTPHRFICFTDQSASKFPNNIEVITLDPFPDYAWNLKKMYAYNRDNGLTGQVFLIDLDVVIVGDMWDLLSYRGEFATCQGAYCYKAGGSFTSFPAGRWHDELWEPLQETREKIEDITHGSERIYYRRIMENKMEFWDDLYPGKVLSYKRDCRQAGVVADNASLVRFHGRPRPHEVKANWVRRHWGEQL